MISEAQFYQIEDAKLLIDDPEVIRMISNPHLSAQQMQSLIVTACSHLKAQFDFFELTVIERKQMSLEIRDAVREKADGFLRQNNRARMPSRKAEVISIER